MTLFDPYSHGRVHELRQEQLSRKARLRERIGIDVLDPAVRGSRSSERLVAAFARISGRRSASQCPQPGSVRPALDS